MQIIGILCEYNPLHLGHQKQIQTLRQQFPDGGIVCLMSGNYVQRGAPAVFDKSIRARAAVLCGADLVLELPVRYALSSAEGFATGGVGILSPFCDYLSFGTESGNLPALMEVAQALLSEPFSQALSARLDMGLSFPAARQQALEDMGFSGGLLRRPNDILAVEYCKAILSQGSAMKPLPIRRHGDYHATAPDPENPSATALREALLQGREYLSHVPSQARPLFSEGTIHTLHAGERAILGKLRAMTDAEFEALPYGSEGLWRRLMHASRSQSSLEDIAREVKSKRYTRTRIDRMILCAFLGLTAETMAAPAPYTRVLALNRRGGAILNLARTTGRFLNAGDRPPDPWWKQERRMGDLYCLFCQGQPDEPGVEGKRRVFYLSQD